MVRGSLFPIWDLSKLLFKLHDYHHNLDQALSFQKFILLKLVTNVPLKIVFIIIIDLFDK